MPIRAGMGNWVWSIPVETTPVRFIIVGWGGLGGGGRARIAVRRSASLPVSRNLPWFMAPPLSANHTEVVGYGARNTLFDSYFKGEVAFHIE